MDPLPLLVLGSTTCEDTAVTRSRLQALGIPFRESDVDTDPTAADRIAALNEGHRVTPTLVFGTDRIVAAEPTLEQLGELLVSAGYTVLPPRAVDYHGELITRPIPYPDRPLVGGGSILLEALRDRRQAVLFFAHGSGCLACFGYARQLASRRAALAEVVAVIVVPGDADEARSWRDEVPAEVTILADPDGAWKSAVAAHVGMPADTANLLLLDRSGAPRAGSSAAEAGGLIDPSDAVARLRSLDHPIILVTGATGTLGREVVISLVQRGGIRPRILSRRATPPDLPPTHEWAQADLIHDDLGAAVAGVDAIIHLASGKGGGDEDVAATRRLLEAARTAAVRHVVVISIIGSDRIPLPFYATKMAVEGAVRAASVPWSIVRVAQFHSFVERLVAVPASIPTPSPIISDLHFQPVDEREAADRLVEIALGPPVGNAPEMAGPELLNLGQIAATWLAVTDRPAKLLPITLAALSGDAGGDGVLGAAPWARPTLEGYRAAWNTPHGERTLGHVTFEQWLRRRQGA